MEKESRLSARFAACAAANRAALVTFISAGDPDLATAQALLAALPAAGADVIELGMPFSDPMADGPAIQASSMRALKAGITLEKTLHMVQLFREKDAQTPLVLMGYYNPIYIYGVARFLDEAKAAGVDGVLVVDLPPEEDGELCLPSVEKGLHFIRLVTPTTDDDRLPLVLRHSSGFVYYVSITGITGMATPDFSQVAAAVARVKRHTDLPIAVGFGVKTPEHAAAVAQGADGVVVGSALVEVIRLSLDAQGGAGEHTVSDVVKLVSSLSHAVRGVKKPVKTIK